MSELEQALTRLGSELEFPETPDVAAAVRRRLAGGPRPRPFGRTLALAFAVIAVLVGAVLAVPPARSAILEWLGLRGATVEKVETLPDLPSRGPASLELGRPVPIENGRPRLEFPFLLVPAALGAPDAAYYSPAVPGGKVSLVYEPRNDIPRSRFTGVGLLVTQFSGRASPDFVSKLVDQGVRVERIEVEGRPGLWIEGGPHALLFRGPGGQILEDTARLAGSTLLLQHGSMLVRLEGEVSRERAFEIAASLD
jgi:hypothetical protein